MAECNSHESHVQIPLDIAQSIRTLLARSISNVEILGAHATTLAWTANMSSDYVAGFKEKEVDPITTMLHACCDVLDNCISKEMHTDN